MRKLLMQRVLLISFLCMTAEILLSSNQSFVVAQTTTNVLNLNLEEAINKAQVNNPQLLAAQRNINVAASGVAVAGVSPNPRLAVDIPFGQAETKRTINVEQLIELGGKRSARLAVANSQVQQAQLQLESLRWQIRTQVRQAYAELAVAQGTQQNVEQSLAINKQLVDITKVRLRVGDVAQSDVVQAEFAFSQAQQKLEPAVNRVRVAIIRLNTLLGQPTDTAINLVDRREFQFSLKDSQGLALLPKLPNITVLKELAKASRLDIALAQQQIQINNNQIRVARSARIPDIALAGSYVWDPGLSTAGSPPPQTTTAVILGVRVDLPLFNNGESGVKVARANLSVAEAQKTALELQVDSEVATAYENVLSAQRALERDRNVLLPQALEVLELSRKSYGYGQTGLGDALLTQQSVQGVFDNFYTDILAYQTALGALEQAINVPLSTIKINNTDAPKTP